MTPRWPLIQLLLRLQVWLYPRIIVSNSHKNTYKHVDTVTLFSRTLTKGQWPLDDLWSHLCWGHMCISIQGSLYPSLMEIHQSMWIQWLFFKTLTKITTYYTTYRMSDHSLFSEQSSGEKKIIYTTHKKRYNFACDNYIFPKGQTRARRENNILSKIILSNTSLSKIFLSNMNMAN